MLPIDRPRLERAWQTALATLLAERSAEGYWVGELSTSALSTAVAISALSLVQKQRGSSDFESLITGGAAWLAANQNEDGGWGDTVKSFSNISTTMLCRAALHLTGNADRHANALQRCENWLSSRYGKSAPELAEAVRRRYGKDRTFAVPILTTCALAGLVSWREVPPLPFELACFPQSWFRFLQLRVVSYALPALIAIGQAVYTHRPPWNPLMWLIRRMARRPSLKVLERIQPMNGGFLEATPLTSFVTLSLASIGRADHPVAVKAVDFIVKSVQSDGSWPIDTNLSTWVTTLSINALAAGKQLQSLDKREQLCDWLLRQQYREIHPYTGADPGAWAWTPLPGGVPDADDTPGALLALVNLAKANPQGQPPIAALARGVHWLIDLQNRDGGWPTFCRGWGHLPFDRSGSDLTAHALRALHASGRNINDPAIKHGLDYLTRTQRVDGSWLPLWFGNQHAPDDDNPVYGTARVLAAYRDLNMMNADAARKAVTWFLDIQNPDGGWGGAKGVPSSIEETALTVDVLLDAGSLAQSAVNKGLAWLVEQVEMGGLRNPTPIGFYFAKLWYFERLYPVIFAVAALGRAHQKLDGS